MKLGDCLLLSKQRNGDEQCTDVYSVTNSQGFVPSEEYFNKEVYSKDLKTYRIVRRGSIAYNPSRINVGSVALQDQRDVVIVSPLYIVLSVDQSRLLPEYLVRFLKSNSGLARIAAESIGTVRNNLKFDGLCKIEMNLPSIGVQADRLKRLRCAESQINKYANVLSALDSLVKSRFIEMFESGDIPCLPLSKCCERVSGGMTPAKSREDYYGGRIPFVKSGDIKGDYVSDGALWLTDKAISDTPAKFVPAGSVLFVTRSAMLLRKIALAIASRDVVINQDIKALQPNPGFLSEFLLWALRAREHELLGKVISVSTSHLDLRDLLETEIPDAPLSLQQEFADFVSRVDKLEFGSVIANE